MERRRYIVTGQVQGVGFRPFVYRCAVACALTGSVGNTPAGVRVEVQGEPAALDDFERRFDAELPPLARVMGRTREVIPPVDGETTFLIAPSKGDGHTGHNVLVSPDVAVCDRCLADMLDPANRRCGYAFTNCTDCGPRYTITRSIPYDRPFTSMACFPLCVDCRREYEDPMNRRFHAQPNACPACGPEVWLEKVESTPCSSAQGGNFGVADSVTRARQHGEPDKTTSPGSPCWQVGGGPGNFLRNAEAILELLAELRRGKIAAIKGLGGFHLACDARNSEAVAELRRRKNRPHKALAVMVPNLEVARRLVVLSPEAEAVLTSPRRPIVIAPVRPSPPTRPACPVGRGPDGLPRDLWPSICPEVIPDTSSLGVMLPCAPLHYLLFHPEVLAQGLPKSPAEAENSAPLDILVMTSGNAGGEPICVGNREARKRLTGIADVFLFHNRDILVRVDDSVLFAGASLPAIPPAAPASSAAPPCVLPVALAAASPSISPAVSPDVLVDTLADVHVVMPPAPPVMLRRARGFVPEPLALPPLTSSFLPFASGQKASCVFAAGAQLKHTFCLTRGVEAFVSQHIGDLDHPAALDFFSETLRHLIGLLEVRPEIVVRDLHPDYPSSRVAEAFAAERGLPVFALQHHFAHIHAVLAEHGRLAPTLGLALDGSGLGEDGAIWGGELLLVDPQACMGGRIGSGLGGASGVSGPFGPLGSGTPGHRRLGHFSPFALPGGEAAIREPWRIAEALRYASGFPGAASSPTSPVPWTDAGGAAIPMVAEMLRRGVNCPLTTSCGRLFDAVAAECGLCFVTTYEGQAAVRLEEAQDMAETGLYPVPVREEATGLVLDVTALFRAVADDLACGSHRSIACCPTRGPAVGSVARRFHLSLISGLADWARAAADLTGVEVVALGGGVLNNRTLAAGLPEALRRRGLVPLLPRRYPPGDGGIALGQAAWGRLIHGK